MPGLDTYKHLNADSKVVLEIDIKALAERICSLNYGAHRLLSALVHELRAKNDASIERMQKEGRSNIKEEWLRSPLADHIEEGLNKGLFY